MTELSARRLLAPLALMMLSTLSCAVFGPAPLPPLANTQPYGPSPEADFSSGPGALPLAIAPGATLADEMLPAAVLQAERDPDILNVAFQTDAPAALPKASRRIVAPASTQPIEEAVLAHLMRYRKRTGLTHPEIRQLAERIVLEAQRHNFDPGLVLAVMHVESRYDTFAVSNRDAMGLMQILPSTGEWMARKMGIAWHGPQTLFDPIVNVQIGVAYLRELADRYDSIPTALTAYNWGPGAIDRKIQRGQPMPQIYAQLVLDALDRTPRS